MLHQYMGRVYSFGYVFSWECIRYWSKYAHKKKNDDSALFILSFTIGHGYGHARLLHWVHVLESSYESSFLGFILMYTLGESMSHPFDFCERDEQPFFSIPGSLLYPSFRLFQMWLFSMLWCRLTITHFSISLFSCIFVLFLHSTLSHLISFFSHLSWCLTWV